MKHLNTAFLLVFITFIVHLTYINNDFVWLDHLDIENRAALLPVPLIYTSHSLPYLSSILLH